MKKKFLIFMSSVALLICALAVCASAIEYDGVYYDIDTTNQVATVNTENRTSTTEIVTIPSTFEYEGVTYRVTKIASNAFNGNKTMVELRILSEYITEIPSAMITNTYDGALAKIYIDFSNIKTIGNAGFNPSYQSNGNNPVANKFYYYDAKAFLESGADVVIADPDFSNTTSIGDAAFQGANFERLVFPATLPIKSQSFRMSTIKELIIEGEDRAVFGYYAFSACTQLEKIVVESRNLTTIEADTFSGCSRVKEIYIDLSKCTSIGGSAFVFCSRYDGGNTTTQWYNLEGEKVVDLSNVTTFNSTCFASSNLGSAKISWPKSIKTLADQSFRKCNINQPMLINAAEGVSLTLPYWCFEGNSPTLLVCNEGVTTMNARFSKTIAVFLADSVKIGDSQGAFRDGSTLYCKSLTEDSYSVAANHCTVVSITDGTINNYGLCGFVASVTTAEGDTLTFGEVAHDTTNTINNEYCPIGKVTETACKFCTYVVYSIDGEEAPPKAHEYLLVGSITYVNFFEAGYKTTKCECSAEKVNEEATENAIFTLRGISFSEYADKNGNFSITQGYSINRDAYNNYVNSGKSLEYGVVLAGKAISGANPVVATEKGVVAVSEKVYMTKQSALPHNYIDVKLSGINASHNGAEIIICMYLFDGESVLYLNNVNGTSTQSSDAESIVINV